MKICIDGKFALMTEHRHQFHRHSELSGAKRSLFGETVQKTGLRVLRFEIAH